MAFYNDLTELFKKLDETNKNMVKLIAALKASLDEEDIVEVQED
jgi:hypothetical protein